MIWWVVLAVAAVSIVVIIAVAAACRYCGRKCCGCDCCKEVESMGETCPFCRSGLPSRMKQSHRMSCLPNHRALALRLPVSHFKCPNCPAKESIRKHMSNMIQFYCNVDTCIREGEKISESSEDRYFCTNCLIDICLKCRNGEAKNRKQGRDNRRVYAA